MKQSMSNRSLALVLCVVMVAAVFAAIIPVYAASDVTIQNGTGSRTDARVNESISYRAIVNGEFTGFGFCMPTWTQTNSYATLSVYKWQGNYEKTVATQPIASKEFKPLSDCQYHWVEFAAQPAGEYLFHISDGGSNVGVWINTNPKNSKGFLYIDGAEQRGEPELMIRFTNAPSEPFGTCEPSEEVRTPIYPYTNYDGLDVFRMDNPVGLRLNVASAFVGMQFMMATYHETDMETDMSVYAWKGTYAETVLEAPVATGHLTLKDNLMQGVIFDEVPAGDYLFLIHNFNKNPAVYVYKNVQNFKGNVYRDGYPVTNDIQYPVMQIIFSEDKEEYFMECSEPEDTVSGDHVTPPAYVIPEDSLIYTHPVMPDTWVFTDGLGRVSLTNAEVGAPKEDKTLAMFYWTWHIDGFASEAPANIQKLSEKYPEAMRDWDNELWSNLGTSTFWWNESIYGFYRGDDKWVLRKQAELLANAGVDVIFTDNTNSSMTWRNAYTPLMEEWTDAMNDGLRTPKVSFMLPFLDKYYTNVQLQSIYLDVFRTGRFQNLWFYWDDKPMLMGRMDAVDASASPVEKEIANFFTFRSGQPEYVVGDTADASWGWLSMYPQAIYYANSDDRQNGVVEQITVGIAMNHDYENKSLAAMSGNNIAGRSYTSEYKDRFLKEGAEASKWGYNFAEQWSRALEIDPKVVFVTGWNEFSVGRYEIWPEGYASAVENAFPDQYNDEFSRDIEPTKGALQDHYYYQLVNFARQYKGASPIPTPSVSKTIDLSAGYDQWKDVAPYYAAYIGNTEHRDAPGYGDLVYTETSGRNDIIGTQVARDNDYVYFLVECAENITPYTDKLWMNLYIDTDQQKQGWNTFEFVVNKSAASEKTLVLEKFTADNDYSKTEKVADVEYKVDGRYMTVKIAKADLGLTGNDFTINFSWTDNVHDEGDYEKFSGDIMDFYISGDVAPGGRFKYSYISTAGNAKAEDDTTETTTSAESTPKETAPVETTPVETDAPKGGCKSSVAVASAVILTAAAAAVALKKKED